MTTPDREFALRDALKLEEIRFMQWLNESNRKMDTEIETSRGKAAARGVGGSPMAFMGEVHIIITSIEDGIETAVAFRRELGATVPALFNSANIKMLEERLSRFVDGKINGIKQRAEMQVRGGYTISMVQEAESKAFGLKILLKQKLAALSLEARLGMHEVQRPIMTTTFNISNSTIANLNLGTIVGDLNSSIQELNTLGRNDLSEGFKRVTEAIAASQELDDDTRKELLEHLSIVSGETAKPAENRKIGPLKASMATMSSGLGIATQALTLWQQLEKLLKATGTI